MRKTVATKERRLVVNITEAIMGERGLDTGLRRGGEKEKPGWGGEGLMKTKREGGGDIKNGL